MQPSFRSVIVATGSHIPEVVVRNDDFLHHAFHTPDGARHERSGAETVASFEKVAGISERRYAPPGQVASELAVIAARDALTSVDLDPETLDYVIVAHNLGDQRTVGGHSNVLPTLASRVKRGLGIRNPGAVAYDILFGCPGWVQAVIQADYYLRSGDASRALVVGVDTLSRVCDPHDRDSMIYADGAGAALLEAVPTEKPVGILAHVTRTDAVEHAYLLRMEPSYGPDETGGMYLKMDGRLVYEYALSTVPPTVKQCLDRAGVSFAEVDKVLLHQANAKMDEAILKRLARLCGAEADSRAVLPMTISWLGNSSVATVPTLLDLMRRGRLADHEWHRGGVYVLASVGAGMNINAVVYRCP